MWFRSFRVKLSPKAPSCRIWHVNSILVSLENQRIRVGTLSEVSRSAGTVTYVHIWKNASMRSGPDSETSTQERAVTCSTPHCNDCTEKLAELEDWPSALITWTCQVPGVLESLML